MRSIALRLTLAVAALAAAALVAVGAAGACTIAAANVGTIDVNAAGIVTIHSDPLGLNVQLTGLPGTLICSLLSGLGTTPTGG